MVCSRPATVLEFTGRVQGGFAASRIARKGRPYSLAHWLQHAVFEGDELSSDHTTTSAHGWPPMEPRNPVGRRADCACASWRPATSWAPSTSGFSRIALVASRRVWPTT